MGAAETVSVVVAGTAVLKSLLSVVREWVRARHTNIKVAVDGDTEYTISSNTNIDGLIRIIESIQEGQPGSGVDDDA